MGSAHKPADGPRFGLAPCCHDARPTDAESQAVSWLTVLRAHSLDTRHSACRSDEAASTAKNAQISDRLAATFSASSRIDAQQVFFRAEKQAVIANRIRSKRAFVRHIVQCIGSQSVEFPARLDHRGDSIFILKVESPR